MLAASLVAVMHIIIFGPKHYFGNKWYVLDGCVVFITAILEFIVHPLVHSSHSSSDSSHRRSLLRFLSDDSHSKASHAEATTEAVAVLLVLMRTWRFIRLFHGIAFSEKLRNDEVHKLEKEEVRAGRRAGQGWSEATAHHIAYTNITNNPFMLASLMPFRR